MLCFEERSLVVSSNQSFTKGAGGLLGMKSLIFMRTSTYDTICQADAFCSIARVSILVDKRLPQALRKHHGETVLLCCSGPDVTDI